MIALINGSTCGTTYSFLRKSHPNGCFDGFDKLVKNGEVKLFWWAKCVDKLSFWESINPFKVLQTYQTDKKYVKTLEAQAKLSEFLQTYKPKIIIAHSVGCDYLLQYLANKLENRIEDELENIDGKVKLENQNQNKLEQNGLENLEFIYLLQSDYVAKDLDLTKFIDSFGKNHNQKIQIYNYFCPFDTALISSVAANWQIPDGLFGSQNLVLQNRFVFLNNLTNFHATMPKSTKFADKITNKLKNLNNSQ